MPPRPTGLPSITIISAAGARRSPEIAAKNSPCPFPATPAIPMTSPEWTVMSIPARAVPKGRRQEATASQDETWLGRDGGSLRPVDRGDLGADHQLRQAGGTLLLRIRRSDQLAAAKDRCAVGQVENFREPMRNVKDGHAFRGKPSQRHEQQIGLLRVSTAVGSSMMISRGSCRRQRTISTR
jgi:hypothetical protein